MGTLLNGLVGAAWLDNPEVVLGIVALLLTLFSVLTAVFQWWVQLRLARRERAMRLYDNLYSADNYRRVVAPVVRIMAKWNGLPETARKEFQDAVIQGWVGITHSSEDLVRIFDGGFNDDFNAYADHFHREHSTECFTEHESLTAFLYFWTKVYDMYEKNLVAKGVVIRLLSGPFGYYSLFLQDLRERVDAALTGDDTKPAWINAIDQLSRIAETDDT